jgi:hypothetical protein
MQAQQQVGLQIAGGMAQPAAGWPGMQLPFANGQPPQQQQQLMQQQQQFMQQPLGGMQQPFGMPQQMQPGMALQQQFAGMMPQQQWAMPGVGLPAGVTGATVQHYMQLMQQKPGGQQQPQQPNGTQH